MAKYKMPKIAGMICPECHRKVPDVYREAPDGTLTLKCEQCGSWFAYDYVDEVWKKCEIGKPYDPKGTSLEFLDHPLSRKQAVSIYRLPEEMDLVFEFNYVVFEKYPEQAIEICSRLSSLCFTKGCVNLTQAQYQNPKKEVYIAGRIVVFATSKHHYPMEPKNADDPALDCTLVHAYNPSLAEPNLVENKLSPEKVYRLYGIEPHYNVEPLFEFNYVDFRKHPKFAIDLCNRLSSLVYMRGYLTLDTAIDRKNGVRIPGRIVVIASKPPQGQIQPPLIYPTLKQDTKVKSQRYSSRPPFEARDWLKNNPFATVLGGNRFKDTTEALKFVNKLYEAGALKVQIGDVFDDGSGRQSSDSLIVKLPLDSNKRKELLKIYNYEIKVYDPSERGEADQGQDKLVFWWD